MAVLSKTKKSKRKVSGKKKLAKKRRKNPISLGKAKKGDRVYHKNSNIPYIIEKVKMNHVEIFDPRTLKTITVNYNDLSYDSPTEQFNKGTFPRNIARYTKFYIYKISHPQDRNVIIYITIQQSLNAYREPISDYSFSIDFVDKTTDKEILSINSVNEQPTQSEALRAASTMLRDRHRILLPRNIDPIKIGIEDKSTGQIIKL